MTYRPVMGTAHSRSPRASHQTMSKCTAEIAKQPISFSETFPTWKKQFNRKFSTAADRRPRLALMDLAGVSAPITIYYGFVASGKRALTPKSLGFRQVILLFCRSRLSRNANLIDSGDQAHQRYGQLFYLISPICTAVTVDQWYYDRISGPASGQKLHC